MTTKARASQLFFVLCFTASAAEKLPGPLFDGLGDLHHPVTTESKPAQRYFNQGMRLLFGFNHKEAIRSFRSAAHLDPQCAMAHWGVAYACGPHVNKPMDASDTANAWAALRLAVASKAKASPKEQAYISALEKRYQPAHTDDRLALDEAFANAMRELSKQYPDDLDAQTLFAESLMNTMPWDYWTRDRTPKPKTEEILAALRFVIARDPDHPGANHFYIHAVEAGPTPEAGLPSADRLLGYAPNAGHLVHMPAHIYVRVGQYADAEVANERLPRPTAPTSDTAAPRAFILAHTTRTTCTSSGGRNCSKGAAPTPCAPRSAALITRWRITAAPRRPSRVRASATCRG